MIGMMYIHRLWYWMIGLVLGTIIIVVYTWQVTATTAPTPYLTVAFLDVGQGDAILITTPDRIQVLIDGGPDASVIRALAQHMPLLDRSLDLVVATHLDKDHVGGLIDVLERYDVATLVRTNNQHDTNVSNAFIQAIQQENVYEYIGQTGHVFVLGASTTLRIFSPAGDVMRQESNAASIVAQLQYGEVSVLFMGDAPSGIEDYLARTYGAQYMQSNVIKIGHHGSRTSTSPLFIETVSPTYAVISAGKDNSYGHPHPEVLATLETAGVSHFSTAQEGTIVLMTDGVSIWRE
jgi:competence protein ComEC